MSRDIVVTIRISLPEGATYVSVGESEPPVQTEAPSQNAPLPGTVPAPPAAPAQQANPICPDHRVPMQYRPAGTNKTTGKPYTAFWGCPEKLPDGKFCKRTAQVSA